MSTKPSDLLRTHAHNWATVPLRLALGITLFAHGSQKLFGWFGGGGPQGTAWFFNHVVGMHPGLLWGMLAGCGEFFGGLLALAGFATRYAAITTGIVMGVAVWVMHGGGFFVPRGIELPFGLFLISVSLLVSGGGALSIDAWIGRSRNG